ncbi:MAG: glycosyltransferase [bacterium]|nr:glycosyltransferase [bacterium]
MRIGLITGEYPPMQGGLGAFTSILSAELMAQGHTTSTLTSLRAAAAQHPPHVQAEVDRWTPGAWPLVRRWIETTRPDVIDLQFQTAAYAMSPFVHFLPNAIHAAFRHVRFVTTFHDLRVPYLFPKAGKLRDHVVLHLARASDGVIVTNHEDQSRLHDQQIDCRLIPIGSNILPPLPTPFDRHAFRAQHGFADDAYLIGFFGLVNHSKGLNTLIEALTRLIAGGTPAQLVIIGGTGGSSDPSNAAYQREIEMLIARQGLQAAVHRTGFLDDFAVAQWLSAVDVVALPFHDGASFRRGSLMAALHYGRPVVSTTPHVTIPELMHQQNVWLTPPRDAEPLAAALEMLYQNPDVRAHLGAGAAALSTQFGWTGIARDTAGYFAHIAPNTHIVRSESV